LIHPTAPISTISPKGVDYFLAHTKRAGDRMAWITLSLPGSANGLSVPYTQVFQPSPYTEITKVEYLRELHYYLRNRQTPNQYQRTTALFHKKSTTLIFYFYLRHFIAFEVVNEKIEKKGAKYHQFFGVRFAVEQALRATRPDGDRKIGVVWHTQGSGKSLSMAYFVAILRHHPQMENPTFVIQVDRTDLDDQLHDQFVAVKALVGEVQHAESVTELRSLLRGEGGEVIFSTIEKFRLDEEEAVHPILSERRNLIVIADEAHRTQYGLKEGFAYQLRRALPDASFIGFTGTPVSFAASDTEAVFGQVIHTYDMLQSKRDGSTVPIYYDPQLIRLELTNEKVDADLQEILEEEGADASQAERARWAAVAEAAGTKERIAELAAKLLDHFQKRNAMINGKAMMVCMSRRNCVRLYDALTA
jgi:type I restriction enzyme R subunit